MSHVHKLSWIALIGIYVLLASVGGIVVRAEGTSSTVVGVVPSAKTVNLEEVFEIQVWVNDTPPLYGADVILTFDPAILEVQDDNPLQSGVQVENGGFLQPGFVVYNYADNTNGIIRYANTQINPMPDAIGSGKLFIVHFKAKAVGETSLNLTKVELANRDGVIVPAQAQNGSVQVILQKPQADLAVEIDAPQSVNLGENFSYYITVDNAGPSAAEGITVTIQLDPIVVYQRSGGLNWNCQYQAALLQLVCRRDRIAAGASAAPIVVTITAPEEPAEVTVSASVNLSDSIEDPNLDNNSTSAETVVTQEQADLGLEINSPSSVNAQADFEYELRVANAGPHEAKQLKLTFQLPQGVTFRSVSGLSWNCSHNNGVVECTLGSLANGAIAPSIRVGVTAPSTAGKVTAIGNLTLSPLVNDPYPENNQKSIETIVVELPPTGPSNFIYLPLVFKSGTP